MRWLSKLFGPPDQHGFARTMTAELRRAGVTGEIRYDPADFSLRMTGPAGENSFFLANAYRDYLAVRRRDRGEVLRRYAATNMEAEQRQQRDLTYDEASPHLLPRVQSRFYHECLALELRKAGASVRELIAYRPLTPGLALDLVHDLPESIHPITTRQLEEWGVSFEEVISPARENL